MAFKIGALAKLAGCPVVTIRFYEKEGLLANPERTKSNYRIYSDKDVERLRFILHCRQHGIKLDDIRKLLTIRENPNSDCAFVHNLIKEQLAWTESQIASLLALKEELIRLSSADACEPNGQCAILSQLDAEDNCAYCQNCRVKK